jgi:hypothetical protein
VIPLIERLGDHFLCAAHDFQRVVLHPSRARENLFMLFLRNGNDARRFVEHHEPRASSALVYRTYIALHEFGPLWPPCILRRNVPQSSLIYPLSSNRASNVVG